MATSRTVNFELACPYCHKRLTGEAIKEVNWRHWLVFFYTESDHQLCYEGPNLKAVNCLDTLNGELDTPNGEKVGETWPDK